MTVFKFSWNLHQKSSKILRIPNLCFFCSFDGCRVISNLAIFHQNKKIAKHIWEPYCSSVAATDSWFILIALGRMVQWTLHTLKLDYIEGTSEKVNKIQRFSKMRETEVVSNYFNFKIAKPFSYWLKIASYRRLPS